MFVLGDVNGRSGIHFFRVCVDAIKELEGVQREKTELEARVLELEQLLTVSPFLTPFHCE